jgi:hypothetical protein
MEHNITDCTHETVAERALIGTWVMDEVRVAAQKVDEVTEIFEVYEYNVISTTVRQVRVVCWYII